MAISPIEVQRYLEGANYPLTKDQLIQLAKDHDAPDDIISTLQKLPEITYSSPIDLTRNWKLTKK